MSKKEYPGQWEEIKTLGELRQSGYKPRSIKEEMRDNLVKKLEDGTEVFPGILGYEKSVIPDIHRAILSRHNISLLGLRGQAKTRIARLMVNLLDEYIPVIDGSELNEDPYNPFSRMACDLVEERGNDTPIKWMHRNERYTEKLATPDVTVADLIGDVDPIKAASLKLSYSDERVIHFGLVPRSHRGIFVINELPDLQARIQVSLFNILQEGDIQIRGFKLRLPLDIQFIFTANPEDYTNRGSIVTPLKDRIGSQILTHYPRTIEVSKKITLQEAQSTQDQLKRAIVDPLITDLIEQVAFEARHSEYVDEKSGVSARLTITSYENLMSAVERRTLKNGEKKSMARISDILCIIPSITGKIELVYEGEQEGPANVAQLLIGKAIRTLFTRYFPNPKEGSSKKGGSPFAKIIHWFGKGNMADIFTDLSGREYCAVLGQVDGLEELVEKFHGKEGRNKKYLLMEFALHGLAEYSVLSKHNLEEGIAFKDLISGMIDLDSDDDDDHETMDGNLL